MIRNKTIQSMVVMCRRLDLLHGGAALRNWQNVQGLAALGPVDVISVGPGDQPVSVHGVRNYQAFSMDGLGKVRNPLDSFIRKKWIISASAHPMLDTHYDAAVARWIEQRIGQYSYDLVVVEELALARYVMTLKSRVGATIFDAHNVESALHGAIGANGDGKGRDGPIGKWRRSLLDRRLISAERQYAGRFDRIWTCSKVDQAGFHTLLDGALPIDVIPNSIDVPSYQQTNRVESGADWAGHPVTMIYLGSYSYFPNEEAALLLIRDVLPSLRALGADARVILIGSNPTTAMRSAAGSDRDVQITGKVDSILPYLMQPCVVTLPLKLGGGTRLKILEAFASSRPVISTQKGVEGIEADDGRHLLIRESAAEMAQAAIEIWRSRELRELLCSNALELVSQRYSLESASKLIRESALSATGAEPRGENPL